MRAPCGADLELRRKAHRGEAVHIFALPAGPCKDERGAQKANPGDFRGNPRIGLTHHMLRCKMHGCPTYSMTWPEGVHSS